MLSELIRGVIVQGAVVNLAAAAAANATPIFRVSNTGAATGIGVKSFKLKKLMVRNNAAGNQWLRVGTGVGGAFVDAIPPLMVLNNLDNSWQELELPDVELFVNMTAFPVALVAGGSLDVQAEVEEIG